MPNTRLTLLALLLMCASGFAVNRGLAEDTGAADTPVAAFGNERALPLEPDEAARQFQLHPGLRIELVASEPQVVDPIAIRFDERGRMWVVEMRDYPHGPADGKPGESRIRVFDNRGSDGRYASVTTFADELLFATGLQPWRGGAIVTMAGQVAYLKDTTGDGRADHREVWYTGFTQENSQLRANHPTLGPDNRIYVANGLRGGTVVDPRRPDAPPVAIGGMDFRFDPLSGEFEAATGVGQFGLTFDDFGNRFVCSNRNPLIHITLDNDVLRRAPQAAIGAASGDVARSGAESEVFAISRAWTTSNLHAGQFTAACGLKIYRGNLLPEAFHGNAFTCEPTGNLVHREVMQPAGMSFTSQPGREGVEFLASTDEWFRPVNMQNGPEGALYVIDMYRAVIEHPQFMPDELKARPDLLEGTDRGRIWRIVPDDHQRDASVENLGEKSSEELVDYLQHANVWQRDTAARLLLERQDSACVPALNQMVSDGRAKIGRISALWALAGLDALTLDQVRIAADDPDARVREQAVTLAAERFHHEPETGKIVFPLHEDDDPRIRGRVALAIAPIANEPEEIAALAAIARRGSDDVWTRRAVTIAAGERAGAVIAELQKAVMTKREAPAGTAELLGDLAALGASQAEPAARQAALAAVLAIGQASDDAEALDAERLRLQVFLRYCQRLPRGESIGKLREGASAADREALDTIFAAAETGASDQQADASTRVAAIQLLAFAPQPSGALTRLAGPNAAQAVRVAAIGALARLSDDGAWQDLLSSFPSESPAVRGAILDGALGRPSRTTMLLDEMAGGRIKASELNATHSARLLNHGDAALRARAVKLFADAVPQDRQQVLADYQVVLAMPGDALRGRAVFQKNCATCHRIGDIGVNVAPDISDSRVKQPSQILVDILQPNRAIDNNYISYVIATTDGRTLTGIIAAETATGVTVRQPEDKSITLLRSEIEEMRSTGLSLMPEGLEKNIPHAEMADLISFVKNWRYLDGRTPLGK